MELRIIQFHDLLQMPGISRTVYLISEELHTMHTMLPFFGKLIQLFQ